MTQSTSVINMSLDLNKNIETNDFLSKLRSRDPVFLQELFVSINPHLIKMLASHKIFGEIAEDITHQCWDVFFSKLDEFEGRSKIKTYLFGILLNKIREYRRSHQKIEFEEDAEKVFEKRFTAGGWWAQEPSDPHHLLQNKQLGQMIQECLEGLSESQKAAFLLIEQENEDTSSACNILGVTSTHLRVLIFRAKDKLKACLEGRVG